MSTYNQETKNPKTGEWELATWHDDYFAHHHYGVEFPDGTIIDPEKVKLETRTMNTDKQVDKLKGIYE